MPSLFLKDRYKTFFREVAGLTTVGYYAFTEGGGIDELTGDMLDESQAYAETPISLSALIVHSPSQAVREKIGLEIEFDSLVRLSQQQLAEKSVAVKIGDAFILPGDLQPPTFIVDQTTYITARVHSILDDAVDSTGRKVKITYKPTGLSEICTVYYESSQNKIDTTDLLGQETSGISGAPTSIVDQTTYLTARVHSILDDATDSTGRKVKITYKPTGLSEVCTVYYESSQNKIDTTGLLGQTTVDIIATNYMVQMVDITAANYVVRIYDETQWHYAKKLVLGKQFENEFLDLTVAVKRGVGRRG